MKFGAAFLVAVLASLTLFTTAVRADVNEVLDRLGNNPSHIVFAGQVGTNNLAVYRFNGTSFVVLNNEVVTASTTFALNGGVLGIQAQNAKGNNGTQVFLDASNGSPIAMARCSCKGGTANTVKRVCITRECDNPPVSCVTGGTGTAYCTWVGAHAAVD